MNEIAVFYKKHRLKRIILESKCIRVILSLAKEGKHSELKQKLYNIMCIIKFIQPSETFIIYKDVTYLEYLGAVVITTV